MKYTFDRTTKTSSKFVSETYFPAIVEFSSEELNNLFLEFNNGSTDMLELSVHPSTHILKRITLTLCNHFEIINKKISIPAAIEGVFHIDGPDSTECDYFQTKVYSNGIEILLSNKKGKNYLQSGNVIMSLSEDDTLISIYIINLSPEQVEHVKDELLSD